MKRTFLLTGVGILATSVLLGSGVCYAHGQTDSYNYYENNAQAIIKKLEDYHLLRSQKKSTNGQAAFAWAELATILHYIPNHPLALERLGELSHQLQRDTQAAGYFEKAIELYPNDDKTLSLYAAFLNSIHDYSAALEHSQKALKLSPTNTVALNQSGLAYYGLKEYQKALQAAEKANHLGALSKELREEMKKHTAKKS